jgi:hypothetical protein
MVDHALHDTTIIVKYNRNTMKPKRNKVRFYSTNPDIPDRDINDDDIIKMIKKKLHVNKFWREDKPNTIKKYRKSDTTKKYSELNPIQKRKIDAILKRNKR